MNLLRGCDVSVFQAIGLVDWTQRDFGIVRATYGKSRDKSTIAHVAAIRKAHCQVGLYHFFRADQSVGEQVIAFCAAADAAGFGAGDLIPFVDVEDFPGHQISPNDTASLLALLANLDERFGAAGVYITQRDWIRLGKPLDLLIRPLWVAHYPRYGSTTTLNAPATPNNAPWRIWQCLVGPLGHTLQKHDDPKAVDQNVATDPLPLQVAVPAAATAGTPEIQVPEPVIVLPVDSPSTDALTPAQTHPAPSSTPSSNEAIDPSTIPWVLLTDEDWAEMNAVRDRRVQEL